MTALSDFQTEVRSWMNYSDPSVITETLLTSFVRLAEDVISSKLRVADMIQIDVATITNARSLMPSDWRANHLVRVVDGPVLRYRELAKFYDEGVNNLGYYTTSGKSLIVNTDVADDKQVELHYFGDVPPLGDDETWLSVRYRTVLLASTMVFCAQRIKDAEGVQSWSGGLQDRLDTLNNEYKASIASGSRLANPRFGGGFG